MRWTVLCALGGLIAVMATGVAIATAPGTPGKIAFRRYADAKQTQGVVYTINADGSGEQRIVQPPARTSDDFPDWSPDGKRLVFSRCPADGPCGLWLVNADGSGLRPLTPRCTKTARDRIPKGCEDAANASFPPDGRSVTYTRASGRIKQFPKLHTDQIEHSDIAIIDADSGRERTILRMRPYQADAEWPMLSPDGKRIVFEMATSVLGHPAKSHGVYVVGANGKGLHRVTPLKLRAGDGPDWSPDGSRILFRSNEDVGDFAKSQIFTIRPDGSGLTQLTHVSGGAKLYSSSFAPDGRRIVFAMATKTGLPDLFTMALDGSDVQQVTRVPTWESAPDWGPAPAGR